MHRLHRDTSGVLVIAKRRSVAAKLGRAFQTRSVCKIYWAIVKGVPKPLQGKVEAALVKAAGPDGDRVRKARPGEQDIAQSAVTHYAVVDRAGQAASFVSLKPVTGRQHQLRAHMAIIGNPILGDDKYDGDRYLPPGVPRKLQLHARRISFRHPSGEGVVDVTARYPITCGRPSLPSASMRATTRATSMTMSITASALRRPELQRRESESPKRFDKEVALKDEDGGGASLLLDGKAVRTPGKALLLLRIARWPRR